MGFLERERQRLAGDRDSFFRDPGQGVFSGKPRDFVLRDAALNLWDGIREDALDYFTRNRIAWWRSDGGGPTGHVLSSQLACINHLYPLRQRPDLASAVLGAIDPEVVAAEAVDDGHVEFEFIGERQYLAERAFSRGTHCTSVDAFMIGRTMAGERRAFLIEWKYTETYKPEDKYIPERARVYDHMIAAHDSPFHTTDPRAFYFEPFYQLMRQALLGWQISVHRDHGCTSYRHVHVVPEQNTEFHRNVTSPFLKGTTVSEAWLAALRHPETYIGTTPAALLRPVADGRDTKALTSYLQRRYWSGT